MNFLETLAAEWYEYTGYFVRTNVRARKRAAGGWDCELDVLALKPEAGELIHVEASGDALPWRKRKERFEQKKFVFTRKEYEQILGAPVETVRKRAIVGYSKRTKEPQEWKDIEVVLIPHFVAEIAQYLRGKSVLSEGVPETYPLLRAIQFSVHYGQ